jgi:tetratricopeptide (TPR) repeat protein
VELLWNFAVIYTTGGDPSKAREFVEEAFELAAQSSDPEVRFVAHEPMVDFLFFTGRPAEAVRLLDASIEIAEAHLELGTIVGGGGSPVVWAFGYRGWILTEMGRLDEAGESLRKCEKETRRLGMTEIQSWTETHLTSNRAWVGDVRGALSHARRAVDAAEKVGSNLARVWAHDRLGVALALDGEWDLAVEQIDLALRTARETQTWLTIEAEILAHLAEAHLGSGDPQQAQLRAVEAIDTGRRRQTPIWEAQAHLTLARVLLSRAGEKARGEIESALESCLSLVAQTQARVYEPHVHEVRAGLADLLGDEATRERECRDAHRLFAEMGATGHAKRMMRELGS